MTLVLSRLLSRLLALVVLPLLGAAALAFVALALLSPTTTTSWARDAHMGQAWHDVGTFLDHTATSASTAAILGAVGALLLGLVLVLAAVGRARPRQIALTEDADLTIRRRALTHAVDALLGRLPRVSHLRVRVQVRRRGGRVRAQTQYSRFGQPATIAEVARERVRPITEDFALTFKLRSRPGKRRRRSVA